MQHKQKIAILAAAVVAACGGSNSGPGDDAGVVNCANAPGVMTYAPSMTVTSASGATKYTLVSSSPAPPAHGNDIWTVKVTNAANGSAMPGLNLGIKTLMPEHGHSSPTIATITDNGGGNYTVGTSSNPLYLFMPGVWQIQLFPSAAPTDTGTFLFCVQG